MKIRGKTEFSVIPTDMDERRKNGRADMVFWKINKGEEVFIFRKNRPATSDLLSLDGGKRHTADGIGNIVDRGQKGQFFPMYPFS